MPAPTWTGLSTALQHLRETGLRDPVDFDAVGISPALVKQVRPFFRAIGLVTSDDSPHFRLRRLVTHGDWNALLEAMVETFPEVTEAVVNGVPPLEVNRLLENLPGARSSQVRFGRLVLSAVEAARGRNVEQYRHWVTQSGTEPRQAPPATGAGRASTAAKSRPDGSGSGVSSSDHDDRAAARRNDRHARSIMDREAELYLAHLNAALSKGDRDTADEMARRLKGLRGEIRGSQRAGE